MPKQYPTESCGFNLVFTGPATAEEYAAAGGDVVNDAVTGVIAWDTLPDWQGRYVDAFEKEFGVLRLTNDEQTAKARAASANPDKVKPVKETPKTFLKREYAKLDEEQKKRATALAQEIANSMTSSTTGFSIDVSPSRKKSKPKADYIEKAKTWLALDVDSREQKITNALEEVPGFPLERDAENNPDVESLARLIDAVVTARAKAAVDSL